jgi:hypothetical protein
VHLSRQYHSKYIADEASYNGTAVKLFHIKYKNAKHRILLLTADATLTMITYTILTLYKRFEAYETMGALFRHTQAEMLEKRSVKKLRWYL